MTISPKSPVLNVIQESAKRQTFSDHISAIIARKSMKFGSKVMHDFFSNGFFLRFLKCHTKKLW